MSGALRLSGLTPIGRGSHRLCYRHPEHPDRCVKVLIAHPQKDATKGLGITAGRIFQETPDENTLDLQNYRELEGRNNPVLWRHIPRCHGTVPTDMGPGLVTDYIFNADGSPAQTLARRVVENYDDACRLAVKEFQNFLLKHLIRIGDLHLSNLLFRRAAGEERERLYIIDGLASQHFLWWPCFYPFRRLKVRRKIDRMDFRIQSMLMDKAKGIV